MKDAKNGERFTTCMGEGDIDFAVLPHLWTRTGIADSTVSNTMSADRPD